MPRISEDVNICGGSDLDCVFNVQRLMESKPSSFYNCTCLTGCFGITYGAEVSMAPIITQPFGFRDKILESKYLQEKIKDLSLVSIYFRDTFFRSQRKQELFGLTEFLCKFIYSLR